MDSNAFSGVSQEDALAELEAMLSEVKEARDMEGVRSTVTKTLIPSTVTVLVSTDTHDTATSKSTLLTTFHPGNSQSQPQLQAETHTKIAAAQTSTLIPTPTSTPKHTEATFPDQYPTELSNIPSQYPNVTSGMVIGTVIGIVVLLALLVLGCMEICWRQLGPRHDDDDEEEDGVPAEREAVGLGVEMGEIEYVNEKREVDFKKSVA